MNPTAAASTAPTPTARTAGMPESREHVAVLGCGLMGSALALVLSRAGLDVVVWNRSPEKARALSALGPRAVDTAAEAFSQSSLVVVCVASYEAVDGILGSLPPGLDLAGVTVVNLSTGTPGDARLCARLALERGASYLDGAIIAYPQDIGDPATMVLWSGAETVWGATRSTLELLGGASYHLGAEIGGANALDAAMSGAFYCVALGAFVEGTGYAHAEGVEPGMLVPAFEVLMKLLERSARHVVEAVRTGRHESDQATLHAYEEACTHWRDAVLDGGQHATLVSALVETLQRSTAAGHGDLGISAQVLTSASPDANR